MPWVSNVEARSEEQPRLARPTKSVPAADVIFDCGANKAGEAR